MAGDLYVAIERKKSNSEEHHHHPEQRRHTWQIFASIAVCYFCICGGNLQGYTSCAIPSMKSKSVIHDVKVNVVNTSAHGNVASSSGHQELSEDAPPTIENENGKTWLNAFEDASVNEFVKLEDYQVSWISGLSPLGAFAGSVLAPIPIRFFGPRGAVLNLSGPLFFMAWIMIALAPRVYVVYIARFIGGIAIGISTSCAPVYIMDTAPLTLRGPLGTLPQVFFVIGILISFILGAVLEWRETAFTCALFTLPGMVILLLAPESPAWLLFKNKVTEAQKSYCRLNGTSESETSEFLNLKKNIYAAEKTDVNQNEDAENGGGNSDKDRKICCSRTIAELFSEPGSFKAATVVFGLMAFQQVTGINGVNFYAVTIFNAALGDSAAISGHMSSVIIAITLTLATLSSIYLIEKLGRKFLLVLSVSLIGCGAFSIGTFFYLKENGSEELLQKISWLPLLSLIIFVFAFSVGYGPVCWIIGAEILSSKVRPIVSPVAVGFNWFCVFAVAKTYPDLVNLLGTYGTFYLYGSLAIVGLVFTLVCVPETKGKTEEEIQMYFR